MERLQTLFFKDFFDVKCCIFTNLLSKYYFTQQHLRQKNSPFLQVLLNFGDKIRIQEKPHLIETPV